MHVTTAAPNFWAMLPALLEICNILRANGNPARLNAINIWRDEQRGICTNLETGEQTLLDKLKEVRTAQ